MSRHDSNSQAFLYDGLDPTIVKRLKSLETTIQRNGRSTIKAMQSIGLALLDAKAQLNHGQFKGWVVSQCGICIRTAERYMRAAEFLEDKYDTVSHLQPSTIYKLSAKGMPEPVLEQVLLGLSEQPSLNDHQVNELIEVLLAPRSEPAPAADASPIDALDLAWRSTTRREQRAFVSARRDEILALLGVNIGDQVEWPTILSEVLPLLPAPPLDPSDNRSETPAFNNARADVENPDRLAQGNEVSP